MVILEKVETEQMDLNAQMSKYLVITNNNIVWSGSDVNEAYRVREAVAKANKEYKVAVYVEETDYYSYF